MADDDERKERVLHTRVPDSLDRHLRERARRLGLSVSTVVRHVLLNTFGLVEDIVTDGTNVALALTGAPPAPPAGRPVARDETGDAGILAWQEAVLNLNAVCARCNAVLRRGVRAAIGLPSRGGSPAAICLPCLARLQQEPTQLPAGRGRR